MKPIEDLKSEHEGILRVLDILERMSQIIVEGNTIPTDHLKKVLDFFRIFADKCHNGKEERFLFAAMDEAGAGNESGRIGAMLLSEHERGRQFIKEMKDLLSSYENGQSNALAVLTTPALQYINLLRTHIWKENNVLFPLAEKEISTDELNGIGQKFDLFEKEEIGEETHEKFHRIISELSKIYLE